MQDVAKRFCFFSRILDGASSPQEGDAHRRQHPSPVCPHEEPDERQPGRRAGGLLSHLRRTGEPATQVNAEQFYVRGEIKLFYNNERHRQD